MSESDEVVYDNEPTGDEDKIPDYGDGETLYERLGGIYGIAGAVDVLTDRLFHNETANQNPVTAEFHETHDPAGFKYLVTAWTVTHSGGPDVYPGRSMEGAHEELEVTELEFDVVRTEIKATLYHVGVPEREIRELMEIIDMFRGEVVADEHRDESWEAP